MAADWVTISSLATAGGTLVLAVATFGSGRSANRAARVAEESRDAIVAREALTVEVLYGDHQGGQRIVSLFSLLPADDGRWMATVSRHWNIDRPDPR